MARIGNSFARLGRHYDKIIAVTVLIGLLFSLVHLSLAGGRRRHIEAQYAHQLRQLTPLHPDARDLDPEPYEIALQEAREPYQLPAWSNSVSGFLVPQSRVWCVDCRRPIQFEATVCPYCRAEQPEPIDERTIDSSGNGIPDWWQRQYGMDVFSHDVAFEDWDGDGFSNLEEYRAGTDPTDPNSHPPVDVLLRVRAIDGERLPVRFMGRTQLPNGRVKCQFNVPGARTPLIEPGETIEVGPHTFLFESYEERREVRERPGQPPGEVDVYVATLRLGQQSVELELGRDQVITEYRATLILPIDDTEYVLRVDETFELRGTVYRLIAVDSDAGTVVIRNESNRQELTVPRF